MPKPLARDAAEAADSVWSTPELRDHIFSLAFDARMEPAPLALCLRFQASCPVCKCWSNTLRASPSFVAAILRRLARDSCLSVARLSGALALPEGMVRIRYAGPKTFEAAFERLLQDNAGWPAVRTRVRDAARRAMAQAEADREAALRRARASALGRVELLHGDLKSKTTRWEYAQHGLKPVFVRL